MSRLKVKLDQFHYHEAMDRAYVMNSMINDHLLEHPAVKQNKEISEKIGKAVDLLAEAYQMLGSLEMNMSENEDNK